eukprot:SAG25_NODE_1816_length_2296_cov_1.573054_1_plen_524_part_10
MPLRLPVDPVPLPSDWEAVAGDPATIPSASSTFVGRLLDFGAARIPSGCVGQVLAHCTALAGMAGETVTWKHGLHARLQSTGHRSMAFVLTIEQSGPQKLLLRARAAAADAHDVLLHAVASFQAEILALVATKFPGCSVAVHVLLPAPMSSPASRGPLLGQAEQKAQLGEEVLLSKAGAQIRLSELVDARPVQLSADVRAKLSTLRFFSLLSTAVRSLQMSGAVQAFTASLDEAGEQALGGSYKDGVRWASRLETHGAASSGGTLGTVSPVSVEAAAVQAGQSRIAALMTCLGQLYDESMDIVASRQFASVGALCSHILREFEWLAPAVLRAAEAHGLPAIPALQPAFEVAAEMGAQAQPEPEPEGEVKPEPQPEPTLAPTGPLTRTFAVKDMALRKYDFFINHCQASGQDQCRSLCMLLQQAGASVWYDMQAQDLTAQGMEEGVAEARNLLIFLSDDCFGRPFCNAEQRWGLLYGCNFVGVVEKDGRHHPADFGREKARAPTDLKRLLDDVEYIEYRRRDFEA